MKQELFNFLKDEHDVTLLETDIEAIIRIVNTVKNEQQSNKECQ